MLFMNNFSILILILITTSIASDEVNNAPKFKTKKTIPREKKDSQRERDVDFESLPDRQFKNNDELSKSGRCEMLGTVFAEGSAMASPHECSFCYCIRGERRCVTPRCKLPLRGCRPRYRSSSCCPSFYDCHDALDAIANINVATTSKATTTTPTTTTTASSTTTAVANKEKEGIKISSNRRGCHIGGQSYFEGQFMPGVGGPCQACYCLRGEQQCTELRCKPPVKGCRPIYEEGICCPRRYDCESDEKQYIRSEVNGKLPRNGHLPDLRFRYDLDYDLNRDSDGRLMENHIRIVRESQAEPVSEDSEVIATTDVVISDEPATVPVTTTTTAKSTTPMIKNVEVVANLNVLDFESTKMEDKPPVEKLENTSSKDYILQDDTNKEMILDTPPVEEIPSDTVPETINKDPVNVEDYAVSHIEDESNFTGTTNTPTEFYDDYYYDYEELEDTTDVPRLSITEILNKLRNKNEGSIGSLADILPDPITGTNVEEVNVPEESVMEKEQDKHNRVQDFVSYDVDVGASLIAGTDESDVIGVGQVIPIDLHTEEELPAIIPSQSSPELPSTTNTPTTPTTTSTTPLSTTTTTEVTSTTSEKTKVQNTLFDTFFSLFRGKDPKDKEKKEPSPKLPPLPPPPPFLEKPPPPPPFQSPDIREDNVAADIFEAPPSFFKPPPPPPLVEEAAPTGITEDKFDTETKTNELDSELDFEAKPTIENEVRARPKLPNGSSTRNQLPPLRRRPAISEGSKPFNPGLFASRPKLPLLRPSTDVEEDAPVAELPSNPLVEGGFSAIKPANETTTTTTTTSEKPEIEEEKPTLPPSLPNLQIIPFVAADALVNQGSPPVEEQNGFSPKPFGNGALQDCREGGKVWKNGETVARGDNDPCVVCRCHLGKVICQRYECAIVPEGCTAEEIPQDGECCPKITCDKSANVSIIDTLPSFKPIEEEKKEESPSDPIRPSPFSHHNRRPPFIPGLRRPKPSNPILSIDKPKLPSAFRTTEEPIAEKREVEETETEAEESSKPGPIRPIRPISRHPLKPLKPSTTTKPFGGRPRPFSFRNRTGTRPPFVPPRRKSPGGLSNIFAFTKPTTEIDETTQTPFTTTTSTTTSTTTTRIPAFILRSSTPLPEPLPEEIIETVRPEPIVEQIDAETFENIFADLLPKDKDSLPQPIHSDVFEEETQSDKPFILPPEILIQKPPEILIPKPLPPTNTVSLDDGDITNFVQQDKFRFTANSRRPEVKFDRQPPIAPIRVQKPNKKLPEIPEVVKAQLPLGNDPILVSGLLELAGCNVYGRMFEVGEDIQEISGQCKACQCTKVGVQCLPIC